MAQLPCIGLYKPCINPPCWDCAMYFDHGVYGACGHPFLPMFLLRMMEVPLKSSCRRAFHPKRSEPSFHPWRKHRNGGRCPVGWTKRWIYVVVVSFFFYCSPGSLGKWSNLTIIIFFRWVGSIWLAPGVWKISLSIMPPCLNKASWNHSPFPRRCHKAKDEGRDCHHRVVSETLRVERMNLYLGSQAN